ncbi:universal stress protein [Marivirga lumbricoides]|uniref:Universal stress protein n=1 Tax=Marivirga lumbricoides TaxID=1046115 RepID=A0ABQ1M3Z2_9BACT|nr:universal stress protein [Marivirga lumbricoides]
MEIRKLCIFLDLTDMDAMMIRYASFLADLLKVETTFFVHVFESGELPEEVSKLFPELSEPIDQVILEELTEQVNSEFSCNTCSKEVIVQKENSIPALLEWAQQEDVDLMVVGKKPAIKGSGTFARKIAKLSYTSVLLLPETSRPSVDKILVPIDFSQFSRVAYRQAKHIAELRQAELVCQHVYKLPKQYFPFVAATDEKLKESTEKHVRKELDKFLTKLKLNDGKVRCEALIDEKGDVAGTIHDYAVRNTIDLIIIGPKGGSHGEYFLMGSVCEKLMNYNNNIKMLIAKSKKEHESLLSEIFGA